MLLADARRGNARFIVLKSDLGHYCAYVGVPEGHALAGLPYQDLFDSDTGEYAGNPHMSLPVHGGLTFAGPGGDGGRPPNWYWYGWDYAHSFDSDRAWTAEEVTDDSREGVAAFQNLVLIVEAGTNA